MPRNKPLTPAQREAEKSAKNREMLRQCLELYKSNQKMTEEQIAKKLGVSGEIIRKVKKEEEAAMDISATLQLLAAGGYEVKRKASILTEEEKYDCIFECGNALSQAADALKEMVFKEMINRCMASERRK